MLLWYVYLIIPFKYEIILKICSKCQEIAEFLHSFNPDITQEKSMWKAISNIKIANNSTNLFVPTARITYTHKIKSQWTKPSNQCTQTACCFLTIAHIQFSKLLPHVPKTSICWYYIWYSQRLNCKWWKFEESHIPYNSSASNQQQKSSRDKNSNSHTIGILRRMKTLT